MIRAVVVGINDYPQSKLFGCVNDAQDVIAYLTGTLGVDPVNIVPLYDGRATKSAIVTALQDMIASSQRGDHLFFHFSGHGTQVPSQDISEPDGLDEAFCPIDFDWTVPSTWFIDDEIATILASVPAETALTAVFDSCHSGDIMREGVGQPRFLPTPLDIKFREGKRARVLRRRPFSSSNALVISACQSNETAADTSFEGRANGAFTYHWLASLKADRRESVTEVVCKTAVPLVRYQMHPSFEGQQLLRESQFLVAPPPTTRPMVRPFDRMPREIVFEQSWQANVLGMPIGVGLRIAIENGAFECDLTAHAGIPLRWSFVLDRDSTLQFDLGFGFKLILVASNWTPSSNGVGFDLAIRVSPPFFGPVTIVQQHISLPRTAMPRSLVVPASRAELAAAIQLAELARPPVVPPPPPVLPRDGENQWTGIAHIEGFVGGLFGTRYEKNTNAYVPPGFIRDHIEVTMDPPNSGNVYFVQWEDSDPHIGRFQFHVGCSAFGGGVATFYMHCQRDPNVIREAPRTEPVAPVRIVSVSEPERIETKKPNGEPARRPALTTD